MKIAALDEYGLRILLRIARDDEGSGLSIPAISEAEGLPFHNTAKFCRILRNLNFINSTKGHVGGYMLARPASEINLKELFNSMGGCLYDKSFCEGSTKASKLCPNSEDCSIRSLWSVLQSSMDGILKKLNLQDLIGNEKNLTEKLTKEFIPKETVV